MLFLCYVCCECPDNLVDVKTEVFLTRILAINVKKGQRLSLSTENEPKLLVNRCVDCLSDSEGVTRLCEVEEKCGVDFS